MEELPNLFSRSVEEEVLMSELQNNFIPYTAKNLISAFYLNLILLFTLIITKYC